MWQDIKATLFHHVWWGIVTLVIAFLYFHESRASVATPQIVVVPNPGGMTPARSVQGGIDVVRLVEAALAKNAAPAFSPPIPAPAGISRGEMASWIAALGRRPTTTAYSAYNVAPTPMPVPSWTPNPYLGAGYELWHHADTYNAVSEALKNNTVHIDVTQQEIPVNRFGAVYLTNGSAGAVYAFQRRKNVDLDIGLAPGKHGLQLIGGLGWNMPHTEAGLFVGVTAGKPTGLPGGSPVGFQAGLVVHPP